MLTLLRSVKCAQESVEEKGSPSGGDAIDNLEHSACTALFPDHAPPADPALPAPPTSPLPGPVLYLATDSRIERQASTRHQAPWILGRLADHRRETVQRVEREIGFTFGRPPNHPLWKIS